MADAEATPKQPFLTRWSHRKRAASPDVQTPVPAVASNVPSSVAVAPGARPAGEHAPSPPLPPVESLSFDSDFTAFLKPEVDEGLRRNALRKLFADPRFNVMDGLDVYIDDYSKSVPIPSELVATLNQARYLFDPPKTRVNEHGYVEDVVPEADPLPDPEADDKAAAETPAPIAVPLVANESSTVLVDEAIPADLLPVPAATGNR